jgi:hypothetical protein
MAKFSERKGGKVTDRPAQMYPKNGLKVPVRDYDSTFSAVTVLTEMFFTPATKTGV